MKANQATIDAVKLAAERVTERLRGQEAATLVTAFGMLAAELDRIHEIVETDREVA